MAKNIQNRQKLSKKETFIKALKNNLGHISNACKAANIHRQTYYSWIDKDEQFKQNCDDVSEGLIDLVESKLLENINNNDNTCIIFFLKTKGKSRGYIEKQEIELIKPIDEIEFDGL
jgi:hypothetical protein